MEYTHLRLDLSTVNAHKERNDNMTIEIPESAP